MRRALLILCSTVSFLVLGLTAVLWYRSYRTADGVTWNDGAGRQRELVSYAGAVHVQELTFASIGGATGTRSRIRDDVPQGADWQTRCGGNMKIVWELAGFVVAAGNNPVIFLTGWTGTAYPLQVNAPLIASGGIVVTQQKSTGTVLMADTIVTQGSGTIQLLAGNSIAGVAQPAQTLTAQTITLLPASPGNAWQLAVVIPYWFVAAMSGLLPAYCLAKVPAALQRRRRMKRGLCACCGYDLRASTGRCPECGTAIDR